MNDLTKILLVDDIPEILLYLEEILIDLDVEIFKATNGNDALKATLNHDFALAILDVNMPEMDGYELAGYLRLNEKTRQMPIIFLSAVYSDDFHVFKGYESGAVDFLTKPFNPEILRNKVKIFQELHRREMELLEQKNFLEELISELYKTNTQLNQQINDRKLIEKELGRSFDVQRVINSILQISLEPLSLTEHLGHILDLILAIPWFSFQKKGGIFLVAEDEASISLRVHRGLPETLLEQCANIPYGTCLCGRAASTRNTVFCDRIDDRHDIRYPDMLPHGHYCTPILSGSRLLGVLNLYVEEGLGRKEEDDRFLFAIANTLAGIIEKKRLEEALRFRKESFRAIVNKSADAIIVSDQDGKPLYVNPAAEIFFQKQASELLSTPLGIPISTGSIIEIDITRANREQGTGEMQVVETTWLGKPARLALIRDITPRKSAENALQESEIKFRKISSTAHDAIIILDNNGNVSFWNEAAERMFGYSSREIIGKNLHEILAPPRFREAFIQGFRNFQKTGQGAAVDRILELAALRKDGTEFPIELSVSTMKLKGEWNVIGIIRDITIRKQTEQRLQHLAHFDVLTNLPNRVMFGDRLSQALSQAKRYNHKFALLFLDLDKFKCVNDNLGHAVGDLLLKEVALRLNDCVRDSDTVARMGGDEFTVILSKITEQRDVALVAEKIFESITRPFLLAGRECLIGVSIGISIFPTDADNEEALIRKADSAMYVVKSSKKR